MLGSEQVETAICEDEFADCRLSQCWHRFGVNDLAKNRIEVAFDFVREWRSVVGELNIDAASGMGDFSGLLQSKAMSKSQNQMGGEAISSADMIDAWN